MVHVGIDWDDVLKAFVPGLLEFINETFDTDYSPLQCTDYNFGFMMGIDQSEITRRVELFYSSPEFMTTPTVAGAVNGIIRLRHQGHRLSIVTSRPEVIRERSLEWLSHHFPPNAFDPNDIHFVNSYYGEGVPKSLICRQQSIEIMVDDTLHHTKDCVENDIPALLFDNKRTYGWNQGQEAPGVVRVHNWKEITDYINNL